MRQYLRKQLTLFLLRHVKRLRLPGDVLRFGLKRNAAKTALVDGGTEMTYASLEERALKLADALTNAGLGKGSMAALLFKNCHEYFEIRIAAALTGIVLVPIIWDMPADDLESILNDCEAQALIFMPDLVDAAVLARMKSVRLGIVLRGPVPEIKRAGLRLVPYEQMIAEGKTRVPHVQLSVNDLASINFSSGSTGRPKGIMLTQGNWASSFYQFLLASDAAPGAEMVFLHTIPFATAGSTTILPTVMAGARSIIMDQFTPAKAAELIERHGVNTMFITPAWLMRLLQYYTTEQKRPSSLRKIITGTERISTAQFMRAVEFFGPIIQLGYGMAEVLPPLSLLTPADYVRNGAVDRSRFLCVNRALDVVNMMIVDENDVPLPVGRVGRIAVRSKTLSQGYWHNPPLTANSYKNGYFYSTDYGYFDDDGFLFVLGRREDIMRMQPDGERIFARQIEEVLFMHPAVRQACVMRRNDTVAAYVVPAGGRVLPPLLLEYCRGQSAGKYAPDEIRLVGEIPVNACGKTDRKMLSQF